MKRLCVIPARKGSKRIPRKNIRDFCGKPIIAHAIQAAKDCGLFDIIHVSTDCPNIAAIANDMGVQPEFNRPDDLCGDHTSLMEVIQYVLDQYIELGAEIDTISLIYATSPLIDPEDLKKACLEFEDNDIQQALLAVTPFPAPIDQAFIMGTDTMLHPMNIDGLATRTQDLKQAYYDAGMFCFYSCDYITKQSGAGSFNQFRGYVVPSYRVTDIDWPEDWDHAEKMYQAINPT